MAVQELFPGTQVTIGPVIEDGFFYDFARKDPFSEEDLSKIEKKMSEIIDKDLTTRREVWKRDKAIAHFKKIGEKYKAEIIESIPKNEELSVYHHGDTWHDLCRGPHLTSSKKIGKAFKLTKVSGAYWRGDSNNEMLQRIYGTCWSTKNELDDYLSIRNLRYEITKDSGYSSEIPPLTVLKQFPMPNARVKQFRKIYLTLNSITPPMVKMPDLTNGSLKNALIILKNFDLKFGKTRYVADLAFNAVLIQKMNGEEVIPGTKIPKGSVIQDRYNLTKRIDDLNLSISEYISERAYLGEWPDQGILFPEFNIVISGATFE